MATSDVTQTQPSNDAAGDADSSSRATTVRMATVTIADANLTAIDIGDLVALWRRADIRAFEVLAAEALGAVIQLELGDRLPEDRLGSHGAVARWTHVTTRDHRERYVLELTVPAFPPSLAHCEDGLFGTVDTSITDYGIAITLVGSHAAIAEVVGEYERQGLAPDLRSLSPYDGQEGSLDVLTERQREVVTTAYEMGFYEVPRETTTETVANELGVDASTVSEHLQRAERNLLGRHLAN